MVPLWAAAGREVRALAFSRRFERVADAGDGLWCRFAVAVASAGTALGLVRRVTKER